MFYYCKQWKGVQSSKADFSFLGITYNYGMNASWISAREKNLDFGLLYLSHILGALPHIALRASAFISHIAHVLLHWKPQLIMFLFHALSFTSFLSPICSSSHPLCSFLVLACRAAFIRPCISGWKNCTEAETHIFTFEQACHLWSMMSRLGASGFHVSVAICAIAWFSPYHLCSLWRAQAW